MNLLHLVCDQKYVCHVIVVSIVMGNPSHLTGEGYVWNKIKLEWMSRTSHESRNQGKGCRLEKLSGFRQQPYVHQSDVEFNISYAGFFFFSF